MPPQESGSQLRLQLLQKWLELEAECDRELTRQFLQAAKNYQSSAPTPAFSSDIDGLLLATERAKAAYKASRG